ncbi:MAG TPA: PIG-L family deacetylase [Mycobacteriales bacterium]|nr:PIG-L family deacetylase [Mycobacteriales bacterium]
MERLRVSELRTVLHVAPHPDDELLGAGGALAALAGAGARVVNLLCSLGRPEQHERRAREARAACAAIGFDLMTVDPSIALSSSDNLDIAQSIATAEILDALNRVQPDAVVGPHEFDGHHAHEVVARGVRDAVEATGSSIPWLSWGLWSDLRRPTLYFGYSNQTMQRVATALREYAGELARNGYTDLLPARARAFAVLGSERVFGFGSPSASDLPYADLLTERRVVAGEWVYGPATLVTDERP